MISKNLSKVLEERGLSARTLAKRAKINESSISLYLSGKRTPSLKVLTRLAKVLEVSLDRLALGRIDESDMGIDFERVIRKYQDLLIRDKSGSYSLEKDLKARLSGAKGSAYQQEIARLHQILTPEVIADLYFLDNPKSFQLICEKLRENQSLSATILSQLP